MMILFILLYHKVSPDVGDGNITSMPEGWKMNGTAAYKRFFHGKEFEIPSISASAEGSPVITGWDGEIPEKVRISVRLKAIYRRP